MHVKLGRVVVLDERMHDCLLCDALALGQARGRVAKPGVVGEASGDGCRELVREAGASLLVRIGREHIERARG